MLDLKEKNPLEMLRQFAVNLNGDLLEDLGAAKLSLNNGNGKGYISLYEVFPGLTAWIYNIEFTRDYTIDLNFSKNRLFYFGYHLSGYQMTKFPNEGMAKKIGERQNFILSGEPDSKAQFKIPGKIRFESCFLIIEPNKLDNRRSNTKTQLKAHLSEIFGEANAKQSYRYFGNIDFRTGFYTERIVKNKRTDLVGRLLVESAILGMLASQIAAHDHDIDTESLQPDLTKEELSGIALMGDYIKENIGEKLPVKELSRRTGLSPKKLQSGVRFLYGHSINKYTANIRLERARELFNETDMNVSQICYKVGYTSRSFFSKQFQDRYGVLPSDYRNTLRKDNLLYEISYRSMAKPDVDGETVGDILMTSKSNNNSLDITGSLIYHRNVFFQLIEGPRRDVLELYEKIKKDSRHFDVQTIWKGSKPSRDFTEWDMAMISDEGVLTIPHDGNTQELGLGHLMGDIGQQSLESKNLWRKVRNVLKTSFENGDISD
ncbi:helix-turn-helix domain-containing protein [Aggregatimonas sangjinii]|uniref:Helix-turn-helix domain-containing protein n=1 Tax=Aggregatimonas sangjinii TaxID=2583587 RepID=A0A5B7SRM7_9FLAO|nr:BLUF domain-containing protein [Aggregatimonas sangjinii]QCX01335.1 helix-turn-helix domain-containing protein [Aggregatimonas sangjinii]